MQLGLAGKRVIITGATRGIGLATALAFADEGAHVAVCGRTAADVTLAVDAIGSKGVRAEGAAIDVADEHAYTTWLDDAVTSLGGADVFVANASLQANGTDDEAWLNSVNTDLMHTVRGIRHLRPHLVANRGNVVAVTTISLASSAQPAVAHAYGSVKAAVASYVGKAAHELGAEGVRVNAVSPGPIEFEGGWWAQMRAAVPPMVEGAERSSALKRLGTVDEVAAAIVFLASDRASYITGSTLRVDGGVLSSTDW